MADDHESLPGVVEFANARQALLLEWLIADGQDLVDEQDVYFSVNRD